MAADPSHEPTAAERFAAWQSAENTAYKRKRDAAERQRHKAQRRGATWQALQAAAELWVSDPSDATRAALAAAFGAVARELDAQGLRQNLLLAHAGSKRLSELDPTGQTFNRVDVTAICLVCELLELAMEGADAAGLANILADIPPTTELSRRLESARFDIEHAPAIYDLQPSDAVPELQAGPVGKPQDAAAGGPVDVDLQAHGTGPELAAGSVDGGGQLVTLLQAAALVNRSVRTLERWTGKRGFPRPAVRGGGGKPHEYAWSELRPFLEKESDRKLPERLADIRVGSGRADRH